MVCHFPSYQVIQGLQILRWFPDSKSSTIHIASKRLQTLSKLTFPISFCMLMLYTLHTNYMSFSSRSPFSHVFPYGLWYNWTPTPRRGKPSDLDRTGNEWERVLVRSLEREKSNKMICLVNTSNGWASEVVDIMLVSKD